jgi:AcrR family transcriptional regulator
MARTIDEGRAPRGTARDRMLDAGVALLLESPPDPRDALRPTRICERADVAAGSFYTHWGEGRIDAYLDDLLVHLARLPLVANNHEVTSQVHAAFAAGGGLLDAVRDGAAADQHGHLTSPGWRLQVLLSVCRCDADEMLEPVRRTYDDVTARYAQLYASVLEATGRAVRPPLTVVDLAVLFSAMSEGLSLRTLADPVRGGHTVAGLAEGEDDWNLLALGVTAVLASATHPVRDPDPDDLRTVAAQALADGEQGISDDPATST